VRPSCGGGEGSTCHGSEERRGQNNGKKKRVREIYISITMPTPGKKGENVVSFGDRDKFGPRGERKKTAPPEGTLGAIYLYPLTLEDHGKKELRGD